MRHRLSGLVSAVLLGVGLPLLVSGCSPRLDPREMWDKVIAEKGVTAIASVEVSYLKDKGYWLTIYVPDSSGVETGYHIDSRGEFAEYSDPLPDDEWHGRVNLSPDDVDFDALVARIPDAESPGSECGKDAMAIISVLPTGKQASWTGCSNVDYNAGSLVVDGKPVNDQVDPRDPAQVAAMVESYNDVFGVGTLVEWNAGAKAGAETYAVVRPFADDPNCLMPIFSSGRHSTAPGGGLSCIAPISGDATIPFDLGRFSPTLVDDIMTRLESLDIQVSAIDELIFTGTPDGKLEWDASTTSIGDKYEYYDQMHGVLEPVK